ncbi:MAG TPA: SpoIIE family protein phosphatase [Rubrobacter sp.]|jgi:serine phosphatase RsbU (regulator of sigma subunit)/ketosteroid isomerase-like protein|nr:SpoIIE family protein phosphatase [Rubrobacter sp.]
MSAEENMALARRFMEARVVKRDLDAVDEMLAPDFVNQNKLVPGQEPDREGYMRGISEYHAALSPGRLIIEDQVAGGDKVVTRFIVHATHDRGDLMGVAPTGRNLTNRAIVIHRIVEGKIAEEWGMGTIGATLRKQRLEQEIRERERVEQELRVARSIQQASLPKEVPEPEGWEISPFYRPAREVGGDFYDIFELEDGRLGLVVGDATGKGVPAALVMASTRSMLRAVAQASAYSPGDVLSRVNDSLAIDIPPNMFVTCFYAILDPKRGHLRYANAGHDLPYLWHGGGAEDLKARGMPLGLMPGMSYEEKEVTMELGDSVLFYSDGLVEAHEPKGEMFGFPRLRGLVAEHGEDGSLGNSLLEELYSFVGDGWEQEDDITLLTLKRSASLS